MKTVSEFLLEEGRSIRLVVGMAYLGTRKNGLLNAAQDHLELKLKFADVIVQQVLEYHPVVRKIPDRFSHSPAP